MSLLDAWKHFTAYKKARSSYTDAGEGSMGTAATHRVVLRPHVRIVKDVKGQEARSEYTIYTTATPAAGDQWSIDSGSTYRLALTWWTHYGLDGVIDHYEVAIA